MDDSLVCYNRVMVTALQTPPSSRSPGADRRCRAPQPALLALGALTALGLALGACGDDGSGPGIDSGAGDAAPVDSGAASADADPSSPCYVATQSLTQELYQGPHACSVAVRLDYQDLSILGFHVACDRYSAIDEAQARATAQADTGYGETAQRLSPEFPEDLHVFYEPPGDFGGVAVVSADNGHTVFGGAIVWDGVGGFTYPATWRPAAELAEDCTPLGSLPAHGYDLNLAVPLEQAQVEPAADAVARTALPAAMAAGGYIFHTVVFLYPRTVGAFDPTTAEWVVVVNGGWLE